MKGEAKMARKIIIVGGGIAGLSAAQAAREADPEARIHLICGEKRLPYYRTRICEIFSGLAADKLIVRNHQWFVETDIQVVSALVTSINHESRQVKFSDGSYLFYDRLVLATGARGNIPEAAGNDRDNVVALRFMSGIEKVQSYPGPVVIVGDGLLGMEAAWHLSRSGRSVVMVGRGDRLLSRQLDREGSIYFLSVVEKAGIRVALNGILASIEEGMVLLEDGRGFEAAAVIFAAGIKSEIKLAQNMGIACNRGIIVDDRMRTSLADVWAAGDCAEYQGRVYGIWPASMAQGAVAGAGAAGQDRVYQPEAPSYILNAMGTKVWSYGDIEAEDGLSQKNTSDGSFTKLFFREKQLVGAELIGDTSDMLTIKKAVDQKMNRTKAKQSFLAGL